MTMKWLDVTVAGTVRGRKLGSTRDGPSREIQQSRVCVSSRGRIKGHGNSMGRSW
jgi:hypothetical protein